MAFIIPLIYFLLTNALLVFVSKKSFGKCIPITLFFTSFVYFFSQILFSTFKVGLVINILLPIVFVALLVIKRKNKDEIKCFKENYFSTGFYSFIFLFVLLSIFYHDRYFNIWDEFTHWGVMVKEMIRTDHFYSSNLSTLLFHKDYPPIIQIFELFYTTISGGYAENSVTIALHLLEFTVFIPFIEGINEKSSLTASIFKSIVIFLLGFFVILLFDLPGIINSIYVDYVMSVIVAYALAIVIFEEKIFSKFFLINLSITLSFLLLTKQIALTLYCMIVFLLFANYILKNKFILKHKIEINKTMIKKYAIAFLMIIVIPLTIYKGWNLHVEKLKLVQQFNLSDLKITELRLIIEGKSGEEWQHEAFVNYYNAVQDRSLTNSNLIKFSYMHCVIFSCFLMYLIYLYGKNIFYKRQVPLITLVMLIGYGGYAFVMLVVYVFSFGPEEGPILASYERYLSTYVIICFSLMVMLFGYISSSKKIKEIIIPSIISLLFLILVLPIDYKTVIPKTGVGDRYEKHAKIIMNNAKKDSKVFIVAQNKTGDHPHTTLEYALFIKYYLDNYTTNLHYHALPVDIEDSKDYFENNVRKYMNEYDYLYIAVLSDDYIEKYGFLYEEEPKIGNIYKIEDNKLILINK